VIGDDGYQLEFMEEVVGNRSPYATPFADQIRAWLAERTRAICVPWVAAGFTDSRTFRAAFPTALRTGSSPPRDDDVRHRAADPRRRRANPVADLEYATEFFSEIVGRVLG